MPDFVQEKPRLGNQYDDDALLRSYLRWRLPPSMLAQIEPGLRQLGGRVVRSEEHTSELQSSSVISYAVFCLKKKKKYMCSFLIIFLSLHHIRRIVIY